MGLRKKYSAERGERMSFDVQTGGRGRGAIMESNVVGEKKEAVRFCLCSPASTLLKEN
jgi:hypothetical protein